MQKTYVLSIINYSSCRITISGSFYKCIFWHSSWLFSRDDSYFIHYFCFHFGNHLYNYNKSTPLISRVAKTVRRILSTQCVRYRRIYPYPFLKDTKKPHTRSAVMLSNAIPRISRNRKDNSACVLSLMRKEKNAIS